MTALVAFACACERGSLPRAASDVPDTPYERQAASPDKRGVSSSAPGASRPGPVDDAGGAPTVVGFRGLSRAQCEALTEHLYQLRRQVPGEAELAKIERQRMSNDESQCMRDISQALYACAMRAHTWTQFTYCSP